MVYSQCVYHNSTAQLSSFYDILKCVYANADERIKIDCSNHSIHIHCCLFTIFFFFADQNTEKMPVDVVSYLYAATVAAGGIIGYVKAGNNSIRMIFVRCYLQYV